MNKDNVLKLIEALESGEYKQCCGKLRDGDKFCVMGVACEVYLKNNPESKFYWQNVIAVSGSYKDVKFIANKNDFFNRYLNSAPDEIREWYGFTTCYESALIELNDMDSVEGPYDFKTLANFLKEQLENK